MTALLHAAGWSVNHKRVERIWRREGLKVPQRQAKVLIKAWRRHYNTVRPHSSLGYRPPVPETATPPLPAFGSASLRLRPMMAAETTLH